jgi:hypothetical protein
MGPGGANSPRLQYTGCAGRSECLTRLHDRNEPPDCDDRYAPLHTRNLHLTDQRWFRPSDQFTCWTFWWIYDDTYQRAIR